MLLVTIHYEWIDISFLIRSYIHMNIGFLYSIRYMEKKSKFSLFSPSIFLNFVFLSWFYIFDYLFCTLLFSPLFSSILQFSLFVYVFGYKWYKSKLLTLVTITGSQQATHWKNICKNQSKCLHSIPHFVPKANEAHTNWVHMGERCQRSCWSVGFMQC